MFAGCTEFFTKIKQSIDLIAIQLLCTAELTCIHGNLCKILGRLHVEISFQQSITNRQSSVILQQESVMLLNIRHQRIRNFHCGRRSVFTNRNGTQENNSFRHDISVKRNIANSMCSCNRRMSVNNSVYIRALLIYFQVHFEFRRRIQSSFQFISLTVNLNNHIRRHESFRYTGWGAIIFIVVDFYGNISVICCDKSVHVNSSADFTDFFLNLICRCHL